MDGSDDTPVTPSDDGYKPNPRAADSTAECQTENMGQGGEADVDFSYLPETVWVNIMKFLALADRYHLSTTCQTLYDVFNHPSNWSRARMLMLGGNHNFEINVSFTSSTFATLVNKFGHCIQHLTVQLQGHLVTIEFETRNILTKLSEVSNLEHLVLEVGLLTSDFHLYGRRPSFTDLEDILLLVQTAFRLKRLDIVSWPMFPEVFNNAAANVFEAMKRNPKLAGLEQLSLFWMREKQWSERSPLLPSPDYTGDFVSRFSCLQHLALRSPMLSDGLVHELSAPHRARLATFQILLVYNSRDPQSGLPPIEPASWKGLRSKSPGLRVDCAVMSRTPDAEMGEFLKQEIPLAAFTVFQYARCSPDLLSSLTNKFKTTLTSFICYSDPTECDQELSGLVKGCAGLDTLVFRGQVRYTLLSDMAKTRAKWEKFEFVEKMINTEEDEGGFDEDTVIGRNRSGDLVQVDLVRFHGQQSGEERKEMLKILSADVSQRLGYTWRPC